MEIVFNDQEIKVMSKDPTILRQLAYYHDYEQQQADDCGIECRGNKLRAIELRAEADRLEAEY